MSSSRNPRETPEYRRARRRLKHRAQRLGLVCAICGEPFDWSLPAADPRAFTADHIQPLARGGAADGPLQPAHRSCNSRRGDASREERFPTTQRW